MKETVYKVSSSDFYRRLFRVLCLLLTVYPLYITMAEVDEHGRFILILQGITVAALIALLPLLKEKIPMEGKILAAYLIWNVITRILTGDFSGGVRGSTLFLAGACCLFCVGTLNGSAQRDRLLSWATGIICGLLFFWSVCGLLMVLLGSGYLPLVHKNIDLYDEALNGHYARYLCFYGLHRNETAPWFMIGIWLMTYQWFSCRNRKWRIPIGLTAVLFYVIVALQHCRSVYLATAGGFAMLVIFLLKPEAGHPRALRRWCIALLAGVVCLGIAYKGFSACDSLVSETAKVTKRVYYQLRGYELPSSENEMSVSDDRDLIRDLKTVTGRKSIWRAIYRTRKADPVLLITGQAEQDILPLLMEKGGLKYNSGHTHNLFMQGLVETGAPGMLMQLAFVLLLLGRMLRVYFRKNASRRQCCILIMLAALLVYGMAEPLLSSKTIFSSFCFMLAAGILAAWDQGAYSAEKTEIALDKP